MELQPSYETLSIYQSARCHNQESADPHRLCRHNFVTSQLSVQICGIRWPCGLWPLDYRYCGFRIPL